MSFFCIILVLEISQKEKQFETRVKKATLATNKVGQKSPELQATSPCLAGRLRDLDNRIFNIILRCTKEGVEAIIIILSINKITA